MYGSLSRIEGPVPQMAQVNLPQEGICFSHSAQNGDRQEPKHDASQHAPPGYEREDQHRGKQGRKEHQFPIAPK
jgi:hypothetical protein